MESLHPRPPALAAGGEAAERSWVASPSELVLVSSGPGEVSNWAVPMARAAASWAAARGVPLVLSLVLPPCQFASGQEAVYAGRQGVFRRILGPRQTLAVVAGLRRFPALGRGCVLHLGGDLWYSATLGRRLRYPVFAYVETLLVRKRARRFKRVFVPSAHLADQLIIGGVSPSRVSVVGDLRTDHLSAFRTLDRGGRSGSRVAFFPGSRRWILNASLPVVLDAALAMRTQRPNLRFAMIISPFLAEDTLEQALAPHRDALKTLEIELVRDDRLKAMAESDLAITYPGTNTVELAILGVPMLVVLPLARPGRIRTEGMSEWLGRIPGLGGLIKGLMAWRLTRRPRLLAWPNRAAGRAIVPELVGRVTAEGIARRALELLADPAGLDEMAQDLRGLYSAAPMGAAGLMMDEMAPFLLPSSLRPRA